MLRFLGRLTVFLFIYAMLIIYLWAFGLPILLENYPNRMQQEKLDISQVPPDSLEEYLYIPMIPAEEQSSFAMRVLAMHIAPAIILGIIFFVFARHERRRRRNPYLPETFALFKNIGATVMLFMFAIFTPRAARQLEGFYSLAARIRLQVLLAYAFVFITMSILNSPPEFFEIEHYAKIYPYTFIPPLLLVSIIAAALFIRPLQASAKVWLVPVSIIFAIVSYAMIIIASIQFAKTPMQELAGLQMMGQNYNELLRASALTLLIVITFSIYIEVLKSTLFEKNAIAAEMAVARQIQSKLVPEISFRDATIEVYGMMQSASAVGGDYIDFIHQNDGHKTLAIADVSGHSVASGLLMSMLKTAFHTELKYAPSLQELMVSLNHTIYANKNERMFISMAAAQLVPDASRLTYVNAGHPPLIHWQAQSQKVESYPGGNVALGLTEDAEFNAFEIPLHPGDIIVFYSDGISESLNIAGEEFGQIAIEEQVKQLSRADAKTIYNAISNSAGEFADRAKRNDDQTILVARILT